MDDLNLKQYEKLGPFEIKDFLAKVALKSAQEESVTYLNAGRGNPNWIATEPRESFFLLGQFAITESKRVIDLPPGVGGMPKAKGIAARLGRDPVRVAAASIQVGDRRFPRGRRRHLGEEVLDLERA